MNENDWKILAECGITPDNLAVGGTLILTGCAGLTELPEGLTVGGSLYLRGCAGLTELPEGLTVGGSLYLSGCAGLTELPDGLTVGGVLDLTGCPALPHLLEDEEREYTLVRWKDHYYAGCRKFTAEEALAHWGSPDYPDRVRGNRYCAAIRAEEDA